MILNAKITDPKYLWLHVQRVITLMKLVVEDSLSLTVLTKSVAVIFFFAEKLLGAFALQKLLTIFRQKMPEFMHTIHKKI